MRFFVKTEVFNTITSPADVTRLRGAVAAQIEKIARSGKMEMGFVAADARMPMFILNVDSAMAVFSLLGSIFVDNFKIETHPIVGLGELGKFFAENPPV
jgi:hypothetical protein